MALTKEDRVDRLAETVRLLAHRSLHASRLMGSSIGANATDFDGLTILLANRKPMLVGAFAKELALTSAAVTAVIDRLEAADLVQRERDEVDRRRVYVTLTEKARRAADAAVSPVSSRLHEALASCTVEELYGAQKVLNLTLEALHPQED
jgi:DNA-binding MarR family transcriptional regulator